MRVLSIVCLCSFSFIHQCRATSGLHSTALICSFCLSLLSGNLTQVETSACMRPACMYPQTKRDFPCFFLISFIHTRVRTNLLNYTLPHCLGQLWQNPWIAEHTHTRHRSLLFVHLEKVPYLFAHIDVIIFLQLPDSLGREQSVCGLELRQSIAIDRARLRIHIITAVIQRASASAVAW